MTPGARAAAAISLLDQIFAGHDAEQALTNWGRGNRYAGSKDRAAVRDFVFDALRCWRSAAAFGGGEDGRGVILGLLRLQGIDIKSLFIGEGHAPPPALPHEMGRDPTQDELTNLPQWLLPKFRESLGESASVVAAALSLRAPVFLRVNLLRADMAAAQAALSAEGIETKPHHLAKTALEVTQGARLLRHSQAYENGLIELQDAASQAVVEALDLHPHQRVLDYCAGGGGKSLAMAALAPINLYAHDAYKNRLKDLPLRAQRAGATVKVLDKPETHAPFDLVLVDAPCSGSGSWRRDPQGKWRLTPERLAQTCQLQAQILRQAAALVADGGQLAYATCSLLDDENIKQIQLFMGDFSNWEVVRQSFFTPLQGGDGFFVSILTKLTKI